MTQENKQEIQKLRGRSSNCHMTIFRLSGSTSLIPNNLIFYKEENENVAVVATKGGVLIGQNQKIKIESEIISLIKLPKYRLAIVRRGSKASDWLSRFGQSEARMS